MGFLLVALMITAAVIYFAWRGVRGNGDKGGTPAPASQAASEAGGT